jgi:hypothetical protein
MECGKGSYNRWDLKEKSQRMECGKGSYNGWTTEKEVTTDGIREVTTDGV